jgi:hypothetical protein
LLVDAKQEKVELGKKVRIDSTVTETDIHAPTDTCSEFAFAFRMNKVLSDFFMSSPWFCYPNYYPKF